ncbi:hypothetical protein [Brucella gallinifaecis]|uniref:hypothetical protein n=1 Tax=Brucella gallinifaecis TaxID=215590 RepID=UPI0023618697|nr:hypothetical protein [Brucella gallinifaecis]
MDTVSVGGDRARPDSAGGGRGHSVAHQTNRDKVTGYVVLPGGEAGKTSRYVNGKFYVDSLGVQLGIPGLNGSISIKPREPHGGSSHN